MRMDLQTVIERLDLCASLQNGRVYDGFYEDFSRIYRVQKPQRVQKITGLAKLEDFGDFGGSEIKRGERATMATDDEPHQIVRELDFAPL